MGTRITIQLIGMVRAEVHSTRTRTTLLIREAGPGSGNGAAGSLLLNRRSSRPERVSIPRHPAMHAEIPPWPANPGPFSIGDLDSRSRGTRRPQVIAGMAATDTGK